MGNVRRKFAEQPYEMFIENAVASNQPDRENFFVKHLALSHAKDLIMLANTHATFGTRLICIPCTVQLSKITYFEATSINTKSYADMASFAYRVNSNLMGQGIATLLFESGVSDLNHCDFMKREKPSYILTDLYHACVHHFLSDAFNYTAHDGSNTI